MSSAIVSFKISFKFHQKSSLLYFGISVSVSQRRHSAQLAKTVELTVTPQPPTLGSTGHLGRPDNSAHGPNCNNYSSEFRLYVEELQVMNLLERISSPGLSFSSREICAVFQATPESKARKEILRPCFCSLFQVHVSVYYRYYYR